METSPFKVDQESVMRARQELMESEHRGVKGVKEFRGARVGSSDPVLFVGTHTHGGESGSAALIPALLDGSLRLERGVVIAAVNNLAAARQGLRRVDANTSNPGMDFNRLPTDDILAPAHSGNPSQDVQRMRALGKAGLLEATHGLDLHTIPQHLYTGFVLHEKGPVDFTRSVGIRDHIARITEFQHNVDNPDQKTVAFGNYIGGLGNDVPVVEIEGGGPETEEVRTTVLKGALSVLAQLGMIDPEQFGLAWKEMEQHLYVINRWDWAPVGYRTVRDVPPYGQVRAGEVLMEDTLSARPPIVVPTDGQLIMGPSKGPLTEAEDWWYSDPVQISKQRVL